MLSSSSTLGYFYWVLGFGARGGGRRTSWCGAARGCGCSLGLATMGQDVLRFVNYIVVLATLSRRRVLLRLCRPSGGGRWRAAMGGGRPRRVAGAGCLRMCFGRARTAYLRSLTTGLRVFVLRYSVCPFRATGLGRSRLSGLFAVNTGPLSSVRWLFPTPPRL